MLVGIQARCQHAAGVFTQCVNGLAAGVFMKREPLTGNLVGWVSRDID